MNISHIVYAQERFGDDAVIERLNRLSFGAARFTRAAFLIRERGTHDLDLSLVALNGDKIVGSVRQTRIIIAAVPALLLGSLVVDEYYKNNGIGAELMRRALALAQTKGQGLVLLVGDASYYMRFGFKRVSPGQITLPAPADPQRILACELQSGQLAKATGAVRLLDCVRLDDF